MVDDSITDPKRVAQLLASELTGLETPPLDRVTVADADESATPSPDGTVAYAIAADERIVGRVLLYPDSAVVALDNISAPTAGTATGTDHLSVETSENEVRLSLCSGVAVKRAVDILRDTL
ncbi:hypothetical protein [Salinibaculum rarum]|uniref:hypothetical protein n=1 Tax=Salinibaculum rarum TaxID=3058903 RepID=UPI00265DE728|nr:hypothetical protein [Salinibaculum sp. KK48]